VDLAENVRFFEFLQFEKIRRLTD